LEQPAASRLTARAVPARANPRRLWMVETIRTSLLEVGCSPHGERSGRDCGVAGGSVRGLFQRLLGECMRACKQFLSGSPTIRSRIHRTKRPNRHSERGVRA
jgi:hypothetical protein